MYLKVFSAEENTVEERTKLENEVNEWVRTTDVEIVEREINIGAFNSIILMMWYKYDDALPF